MTIAPIRVSDHAVARARERLFMTANIADEDIRRAIVASMSSVAASAPGRGGAAIIRTRAPLALRLVVQDEGDETVVVTVMRGAKSRGNVAAQKARRCARRDAAFVPLLVTASLASGLVRSDPWSPALDGLLAAATMRKRLGEEDYIFAATRPSMMRPVEHLPLRRIEHGDLWWYACSAPILPDRCVSETRHFHRRFDDAIALDRLVARKVQTAAGPYKAYRLSETRIVTLEISWHAIGDREAVAALLDTIPAIGGGRARGHGEVTAWRVEACGNPGLAMRHRPLPVAYATEMGILGATMLAGFRPPARLPCNVAACVVPC